MKIYESPDKGNTIFAREFNSSDKIEIKKDKPKTYQEMIDLGYWMTADGFWMPPEQV